MNKWNWSWESRRCTWTHQQTCSWRPSASFSWTVLKIQSNVWIFHSPLSVCWPEPLHLQRESSGFCLQETKDRRSYFQLTTYWFLRNLQHTHILRGSCDHMKTIVGGFDVNTLRIKHKSEGLLGAYHWVSVSVLLDLELSVVHVTH